MKNSQFWALYNCGTLWCVERTKRACREEAERGSGVPWKDCKKYFHIKKVTVSEGWAND